MENILGLTDFIKLLGTKSLGQSLIYFVTDGDTYNTTTSKLTATATRHKVKISTSQVLMCEEGKLIVYACKVTRK